MKINQYKDIKITSLITHKRHSHRESESACVLDAADNLHKGLFKESPGNVNDRMNVRGLPL